VIIGGCLGTRTVPGTPTSPPAILVDYHRTDGIAGFNDRLVVFDNGAAVISSGIVTREIMLNQTDLDRITLVFTTAQFSMLEGNYTASRVSADFIHYSISYHSKTVNTVDSSTPVSLQPVIDELNRIMRTGAGPDQLANPFANLPT
jgi:hypothetical protein